MEVFTFQKFREFFTAQSLGFDCGGESCIKFDFSRSNLKEEELQSKSRSKSVGSLILLLMLFLFSNFLTAQVITVDGNTSDWSNNPSIKHVQDPFGSGVVDDQFTQGSKDFLFANQLNWEIGQTKAKNDIANGGFGLANQVKYVDVDNVTQTLNGNFLVFAGDRVSNNGDAQIGFWFYLNSTAPVEVVGEKYFAPPHTRGDLLVLADFTGGGRLGTVKVYRWIGGEAVTPGSTVVDNSDGNLETTNISSIVAENNSGTPNVPAGWNFPRVQYQTNEFYEGFVDLGNIGGNTNFTCTATVLLETRSSQSITASLDDFIGGTLGEVPTVTVGTTPVLCFGGSSTVTATPRPAGTYTYTWTVPVGASAPGNVASFSTTIPGTYSVIVTNSTGCPSELGSGIVAIPTEVTLGLDKTDVLCFGDSNGKVTATFSGGTDAYMAKIDGGDYAAATSPKEFTGLAAGSHTVWVKDANGCEKSMQITVGTPTVVTLGLQKTDVLCFGDANGKVTATFSGGTGAYMVKIDGGDYAAATSPKEFTGLAAGSHTVWVKDANGCEKSMQITVGTPTVVTLGLQKTDVLCFGDSNGKVTATFSGGTGAYMVKIDGGTYAAATSPKEFTGLAAGSHTVWVKDANGCEKSMQITVGTPTVVTLGLDKTDVLCFGDSNGKVTATFSGGTGAYMAKIDGGTYAAATSPKEFTGLAAGSHTVWVKDANGCEKSMQITVGTPTVVVLTAQGTEFCYGESGSITFSATGGTGTKTYTVNGNAATSPFSVSTGGTYTIVAKDANNCIDTKQVNVTVNPLPQISCPDPASTTVLCGVTIAAAQTNTDTEFSSWLSGFTYDATLYTVGISYLYDPSTNTVKSDNGNGPKNPMSGGAAKVTVTWTLTDKITACKNSCSSTFTIDNGCKIDCSAEKTDVLCEGTDTGTITISADGGAIPYTVYLYKEGSNTPDYTKANINTSPFSVTFENLFAGNYTYEVIDANYATTQEVCNEEFPIVVGSGAPCGAHCTYTQGYYGNDGGKSCAGEEGVPLYSTADLIQKALMSYPSETMTIGVKANGIVGDFNEFGHSVSMSNNATDIAKIIEVLPGGGSSVALLAGDFPITGMPSTYLKKGNINNTLLAQTITLGLNLGIDSTLGSFALQAGTLATAETEGGCGSKTPKVRSCTFDVYTPTINEYKYFDIPAVVNLLPTKTVQGLFDMANKALGGETLPAGVTLSNLASAVDVINNAFDGCRISMGYDQTPLTCIADRAEFDVSPVPIVDYATITYKFSYVSDVTIEVWNLLGVMLHTQNDTNSYLDKQVLINYNFTASGTYVIKIHTNIGSSTRTVIKN